MIEDQAEENVSGIKSTSEDIRKRVASYSNVYVILYAAVSLLILLLCLTSYYIIDFVIVEMRSTECGLGCFFETLSIDKSLPIISAGLALTLPQIWLIRIVARIADEAKVMATDYERLSIIEVRTDTHFASADSQKRQDALREQFINHMMTRSPVETLLKLRKRRFFKENKHPVEDFCSKCMELIKKDKGVS